MVHIIIDSSSDISPEKAVANKLDLLPMKIVFGKEEFRDGIDITHREFYQKLTDSEFHPTTSQISPYQYGEIFEKIKSAGDSAVVITVSSKLSGSYQSANIALEGYEDCIHIVDSGNVSVGEQLLIGQAIELRDKSKQADEIAAELNEIRDKVCVLALLDTLEYLRKGGRISGAAALAGGLLSIKSVLTVTDGVIVPLGKARGSKNGQNLLRQFIAEKNADYSLPCALGYTGLDNSLLQSYIDDSREIYDKFSTEPSICTIGSTIGTHVGPNTIAIAFFAGE